MKTLIIFILVLALGAGAFLSRPSEASFKTMLDQQQSLGDKILTDLVGSNYEYKDRFLWVDMQQDGKTVYTGAFGSWFKRGTTEVKRVG